jgi:hypothetical protein
MAGETLVRALNIKASKIVGGVPTVTATAAANLLASTTGKSLVGALNSLNSSTGIDLAGVLNKLAGTTGLDVAAAALAYSNVSAATAPGAPTSVSASAASSTVTVTWTAPSDGGSAITSYTVQRSSDGTNWTTQTDTDGNATNATATLTSQANGTYTYRVAATNSIGTGSYGTSGSVVVSAGSVPGAPTFTSGPVFAGYTDIGTDTITEQVTATGTGIIDYEFTFLRNNVVYGTRTLTKAQAEASHSWASTATATTFLMTYNDGNTLGPGYVFSMAGNAATRTAAVSGVRVRARNATGYSTATFSAGTGQIFDE